MCAEGKNVIAYWKEDVRIRKKKGKKMGKVKCSVEIACGGGRALAVQSARVYLPARRLEALVVLVEWM